MEVENVKQLICHSNTIDEKLAQNIYIKNFRLKHISYKLPPLQRPTNAYKFDLHKFTATGSFDSYDELAPINQDRVIGSFTTAEGHTDAEEFMNDFFYSLRQCFDYERQGRNIIIEYNYDPRVSAIKLTVKYKEGTFHGSNDNWYLKFAGTEDEFVEFQDLVGWQFNDGGKNEWLLALYTTQEAFHTWPCKLRRPMDYVLLRSDELSRFSAIVDGYHSNILTSIPLHGNPPSSWAFMQLEGAWLTSFSAQVMQRPHFFITDPYGVVLDCKFIVMAEFTSE